jgi:hypothetical protein
MVIGGMNLDVWRGPGDARFRAGYSFNPRTKAAMSPAEWFSDAAAHDPAMDSWEPLPRSPLRAHGSTAFWTGRELLVWGRWGERYEQVLDGVAYDPERRKWRRLATWPAERDRAWTAVWTGTGAYRPGQVRPTNRIGTPPARLTTPRPTVGVRLLASRFRPASGRPPSERGAR